MAYSPDEPGHSMNARHRPGSAADRADAPWKDLITDAICYCLQWGRAKPPPLGGSLSTPLLLREAS